jgi:LmbE family N-acetylglucosaminyl deacetylase
MKPGLLTKDPSSEHAITHPAYDYIYISPHLDDVPLSCSGSICGQKAQELTILVVTLFAGQPQPPFSPFAQSVHRTWHAPEERPYQVRKEEERKAMAMLGVDYLWLDWFEILYRDPELSEASDLFCEPGTLAVHPGDASLYATLCSWLAGVSQTYSRAQMVVPLGLGWHRDHNLVFQAALKVLDRNHLLFFEDFPYATYYSSDELMEYVKPYNMIPVEVDISECLEQRIAVSEAYQSQIPTFYYAAPSFQAAIREYTLAAGEQQRFVERYWKIPS